MRSAQTLSADLTARARIRDSAILYIGRHGSSAATMRAIAADAGVSPALVIHHFGSKDGLREECDAHVTQLIDDLTRQASSHLGVGDTLDLIGASPRLAPLAHYVVRTMNEGGAFAQRLWQRLVDDTERYLQAAVAGGVARPTEDERARAELVVIFKLGTYSFARYGVDAPSDTHPADLDIPAITDRYGVPALELFTHGLYLTDEYLNAFRRRSTTTESRQS